MPNIEGLDPRLQVIGSIIFVAVVAVLSGWSLVFGRKKADTTQTKEFSIAGQLADMTPVKQLVEQTGLVFQQQVRTNIHLEAHTKKIGQAAIALSSLARQIGRLADAYERQLREQEQEEEIERKAKELAERMVEDRLADERRRPSGARKTD